MKKMHMALLLCLAICFSAVLGCAQDVSHYLVMGYDHQRDEMISPSFADMNLIVSLDKTNNRLVVITMMGDSSVTMPNGTPSKLNQVIRQSDFDTMIKTVQNTLHIQISGYAAISTQGFVKLIGELGGIEVNISQAEYEMLKGNPSISGAGKQVLQGEGMLAYICNQNAGGYDQTHTKRMRTVVAQMVKKAKAMSAIELLQFATIALSEVKTDMNVLDAVGLAKEALGMKDASMDTYAVPVDGTFKFDTENGDTIINADWEANRTMLAAFIAGKQAAGN